ncbi:hypothetical protein OG756_12325 [Streptomyces sp. NBC_01310]|uniref:hypothetical protein n=1 Tax=Streptomyces sp. NBC_01310 TaxID=2903820 RepID=UPI0035B642B0|nr:hypothetical protein OG756_12325 [Streptomyces sp. NBC_01310]
MTRSAQRAAQGPRLLLLAALLLGIVTMHTLGHHPTESHAMEDGAAARSVASAGSSDPAAQSGARHTPALPPTARAPEHGGAALHEPARGPVDEVVHEPVRGRVDEPVGERARAAAADAASPTASQWGSPAPGTGMDPMSVCLAVLTGLVLLLLGSGLAGARDTASPGGASRTPGRSGGGPDPPSPRELLTRLAVLRI